MEQTNGKLSKVEETEKFRKWVLIQISEKIYDSKYELIRLITDLNIKVNSLRDQFLVPGIIGEEGCKYDNFQWFIRDIYDKNIIAMDNLKDRMREFERNYYSDLEERIGMVKGEFEKFKFLAAQ